jgi:hypothetical protein
MGPCVPKIAHLKKLFMGWEFYSLESEGFSKGNITFFQQALHFQFYFSVFLGLYTEVHSKEMENTLSMVNLYSPYEG